MKACTLPAMLESLFFWLSRIAAGILEWKVHTSEDGGFRLSVLIAAGIIVICLVALSLYA